MTVDEFLSYHGEKRKYVVMVDNGEFEVCEGTGIGLTGKGEEFYVVAKNETEAIEIVKNLKK